MLGLDGQLEAIAAVRSLERVRVFSPTPENRRGFAEHYRKKLNLDIRTVDTAEEAVRDVRCRARFVDLGG